MADKSAAGIIAYDLIRPEYSEAIGALEDDLMAQGPAEGCDAARRAERMLLKVRAERGCRGVCEAGPDCKCRLEAFALLFAA